MKITKDFIPAGRNNRPGKKNAMRYITIHNTGNADPGAGAKNHASYVKGTAAANAPVSWHYTVDEKEIYQHLPDTEIGWHAGDGTNGTGNNQSIGVEICMNSDGNLLQATDQAVLLIAELCAAHKIPVGNVVQHNRWSGKNCPQILRNGKPYSWDTFIEKVRALLEKPASPLPAPAPAGRVQIGDRVIANGYPYVSSGGGKAGVRLNNMTLPVTKLNPGSLYPVHVGSKGWMRQADVRLTSETVKTCPVVKGDTLSGIGAKHQVKWQDIAAVNGIKPPYLIYPGQTLRLP